MRGDGRKLAHKFWSWIWFASWLLSSPLSHTQSDLYSSDDMADAVSRLLPLSSLKSGTDILRFNIFQDISSEDDDGELDKESGWLSETHQNLAWSEPASGYVDVSAFSEQLVILLNLVTSCDILWYPGEKRSHCWADFGLALGARAIGGYLQMAIQDIWNLLAKVLALGQERSPKYADKFLDKVKPLLVEPKVSVGAVL